MNFFFFGINQTSSTVHLQGLTSRAESDHMSKTRHQKFSKNGIRTEKF
jgi:hypothetical protein